MGIVKELVPGDAHDYFDAPDSNISAVVQLDSVNYLELDSEVGLLFNDQNTLTLHPPPVSYYQLVDQETQNVCYESVGDLAVSREMAFIESAVDSTPPFLDIVLTPRDETWELLPSFHEIAEVCSSDTKNSIAGWDPAYLC